MSLPAPFFKVVAVAACVVLVLLGATRRDDPPRLDQAAPGSIVWASPPAPIVGGTPLYYGEVVWVGPPSLTAPVALAPPPGRPGTYTPVILTPAPLASRPSRTRLEGEPVTIEPLGPPEPTPIELEIAQETEAIKALGLELQRRYARLLELKARLEAGETEP